MKKSRKKSCAGRGKVYCRNCHGHNKSGKRRKVPRKKNESQ